MKEGLELFKTHVRPLLTECCLNCHGGKSTKGDFDLSTRESLLKSGMVEEGKLPVKEAGAYDIRAFLSFEPAERERYDALHRQGMHPRAILKALGRG